jgi:4-hydroxybenzoate polyprenyltransferase/phosphoserine phosphatase
MSLAQALKLPIPNPMPVAAATARPPAPARDLPLVVDLDGTLLRTDLLFECAADALRHRPGGFFRAVLGAGSRSALKARLAQGHGVDLARLPLRAEVVARIKAERAAGRRIVLATASTAAMVQPLAEHLGLFDEVLASDEQRNLKGANKAAELVSRYGVRGFDYVGDSRADLAVWQQARGALLVGPGARSLAARAAGLCESVEVLEPLPVIGKPEKGAFGLIRPRQWVKNLLVFLPLLAGHQLGNPALLMQALLAFFCVSFAASATYVLNDMLDIDSDRRHATKCRRPLASGAVSIPQGVAIGLACLAASVALMFALPPAAAALVVTYLVTTTAYSTFLKRKLLVDVFALALLYTLRVLIGSEATGLLSSPWLLGFSVFLFLSLAFAKRAAEVLNLDRQGRVGTAGRDYYVWDKTALAASGIASAFGAAMVLALYIQGVEVVKLYRQPSWLWIAVPLMTYWLTRVWLLTMRGAMDEDPVVFATTDRTTWKVIAALLVIGLIATWAPFGLPGARP